MRWSRSGVGSNGVDQPNVEPLSDGTYYFELLLTLANGAVKPRTGHLTLQR